VLLVKYRKYRHGHLHIPFVFNEDDCNGGCSMLIPYFTRVGKLVHSGKDHRAVHLLVQLLEGSEDTLVGKRRMAMTKRCHVAGGGQGGKIGASLRGLASKKKYTQHKCHSQECEIRHSICPSSCSSTICFRRRRRILIRLAIRNGPVRGFWLCHDRYQKLYAFE